MFKHILLPTDGSELSEAAIKNGMPFARSINASVTGINVILPFHILTIDTLMLEDTEEQYARDSVARAKQYLAVIENAAKDAGVPCDTLYVTSNDPYDAIIKTAWDKQCDLIMMASHGRRGVQGMLLGSETQKVLTHTRIPVLVFH
jgi:nucleotide-binding universal stress UspA family protein